MSPQIWNDFQTRFNIGTINEFYASTEGNCNVMNPIGHPMSCGFLPCGPARAMFPVSLGVILWFAFYRKKSHLTLHESVFRLDKNGDLARDENGLCIPVKSGEVGMIMGKVRRFWFSCFFVI